MGIKIITKVTNTSIKKKLTDSQSGFRAYNKQVLTQINPSDVKGYRISLTSTRSSYNLPVTDNLFSVTVADAVRLTTA